MLNPDNWEQVMNMVSQYAAGVPKRVLWYSVFGKVPANSPNLVREWMNFYFGEREKANIDEVVAFLHQEGIISVDKLPEGTVDDSLTRKVFKASGHKPVAPGAALGVIEGRSAADCPLRISCLLSPRTLKAHRHSLCRWAFYFVLIGCCRRGMLFVMRRLFFLLQLGHDFPPKK